MRTKLLTWIGLLLSLGLVLYLGYRFDLQEIAAAVALAEPGWVVLGSLVYIALFPLRGLRLSILFRDLRPISPKVATEVFLVGFLANNIMPARLGDVVRAVVLGKREGVPVSTTFSNVMLERVFDGLTVVAFLGAVLWIAPPPVTWVQTVGLLMGLIFAGAIIFALLVTLQRARAEWLIVTLIKPLPATVATRILALFQKLADGFRPLRNLRAMAKVAALSCLIWSVEVVVYGIVQRAFGMQIPGFGLVLIMSLLTLGLTAPSAPGFIGLYEGIVISAVAIYGVGEPTGPAFAITMHAIHYIPGTLWGMLASWRSGLRIRELRAVAANLSQEPGTEHLEPEISVP